MRYTTIVDISEYSSLYRNHNARLVYLHLALRSGYHDNDRDLIDVSVRRLADAVGLTVSATRHALKLLQDGHMIRREGPLWRVRKYVLEQDITPRAKSVKEAKRKASERQRDEAERARDKAYEQERERREQLQSEGKNDFMVYYEELASKAAKGDMDALRICKQRRQVYVNACQQFGSKPVDI